MWSGHSNTTYWFFSRSQWLTVYTCAWYTVSIQRQRVSLPSPTPSDKLLLLPGCVFFFFNWNLFLICLHWVLAAALGSLLFVAACRLFSCRRWTLGCGIWALVPWPGMEPGPPALGVWSPSHWASGQVPVVTCWCGYGGGHEATGNDCGSLSSVPSPPGYWNRMCVAWLSWVIQNSN